MDGHIVIYIAWSILCIKWLNVVFVWQRKPEDEAEDTSKKAKVENGSGDSSTNGAAVNGNGTTSPKKTQVGVSRACVSVNGLVVSILYVSERKKEITAPYV